MAEEVTIKLPFARTDDISQPVLIQILESATAWTLVSTGKPMFLKAVSGTPTIRFRPWAGNAASITNGEFYTSRAGTAYLFAAGAWWVNLPVAGASAVTVSLVLLDAGVRDSGDPDLSAILTGADLSALYAPRVMAAPTSASVAVTSGSVVAEDGNRKLLYIRNVSTGGQRISLGFGAAAVLDDGITITADEWVSFDLLTGGITDEVFAISSAASGEISIQVGT